MGKEIRHEVKNMKQSKIYSEGLPKEIKVLEDLGYDPKEKAFVLLMQDPKALEYMRKSTTPLKLWFASQFPQFEYKGFIIDIKYPDDQFLLLYGPRKKGLKMVI